MSNETVTAPAVSRTVTAPIVGGPGGAGVLAGQEGFPEVPDDIREVARLAPDHWVGMLDPGWAGEGTPPRWAVVGEWRSGLDGEVEEWRENEEHRPSPTALGWPAPSDEVDEAIQLAITGYGPGEAVTRTFAVAEVAVLTDPRGAPVVATTPDGIPVIPVFTHAEQLAAAGRLAYRVQPVRELVAELAPEERLMVNPTGVASVLLETDALLRAIAERTEESAAD
ncbi:type VII secretion system-associated protein [Streptomyces sp.]|uniref:type VII secretion system-associated protein n=1 Tax=Streptomyces sp. TaxID=1931 RepID=UPI002F3FB2C5